MQIFKTNEFFCGLSIPDPGTIDPIEKKLPRDLAGADGVDFMKVFNILNSECLGILRCSFYHRFALFKQFSFFITEMFR